MRSEELAILLWLCWIACLSDESVCGFPLRRFHLLIAVGSSHSALRVVRLAPLDIIRIVSFDSSALFLLRLVKVGISLVKRLIKLTSKKLRHKEWKSLTWNDDILFRKFSRPPIFSCAFARSVGLTILLNEVPWLIASSGLLSSVLWARLGMTVYPISSISNCELRLFISFRLWRNA